MSKELKRFADDLADEALLEAATTFFGIRKRMDDEVEYFHNKLDELKSVRLKVMDRAATFHLLLGGKNNAAKFYAAMDMDPGALLNAEDESPGLDQNQRRKLLPRPMALTRAGAHIKLTLAAYAALQDRVDEYLHGRFYNDPMGSGHKLSNAYYSQITHWCATLNERIRAVNKNMPPSGTRQFVKRLDPAALEKERLADAPLDHFADTFDQDLELKSVDCSQLDGLVLPDLPPGYVVRDDLAALCRDVYDTRRDEIRDMLEHWED